jgi:hypothetical protein
MDARRIPKKCEKSFSWATGLTRRHEVVARSLSPRRKPPVQDLIDRPRTSLGTGRSLQARLRDHLQRRVAISRGERLRQKGLETRIVVQVVRAFLVYWGGPSHFRRGRAASSALRLRRLAARAGPTPRERRSGLGEGSLSTRAGLSARDSTFSCQFDSLVLCLFRGGCRQQILGSRALNGLQVAEK